MKATWDDIERALNSDTLETQNKSTLKAFLRVQPPASRNPSFHARFADAKERIRYRLAEIAQEEAATRSRASETRDPQIWFVGTVRLTRDIRKKVFDAKKCRSKAALATVQRYLDADHDSLMKIWPQDVPCEALRNLGRHIQFAEAVDFRDILEFDLPEIEETAEKHFSSRREPAPECGFESLLHPVVKDSSYAQFRAGHFRDAVLNSIIGLCDHVRKVTGLKHDGAKLMNEVFGGEPILIFSELETDSGRNDQAGFHKIFLGACEGIRNPKAHSLANDLTPIKAAQYLVFASLLARRVDECKPAPTHE